MSLSVLDHKPESNGISYNVTRVSKQRFQEWSIIGHSVSRLFATNLEMHPIFVNLQTVDNESGSWSPGTVITRYGDHPRTYLPAKRSWRVWGHVAPDGDTGTSSMLPVAGASLKEVRKSHQKGLESQALYEWNIRRIIIEQFYTYRIFQFF